MICHKCGAINNDNSIRCRSCYTIFQDSTETVQYTKTTIQSPLREVKPANISTVSNPYPHNPESAEHQATQSQHNAENTQGPSESAFTATQGTTQTTASKVPVSRNVVVIAGSVLILFAAILAFVFVSKGNNDAGNLFAKAELQYNNEQFAEALFTFRQFLQEYPNDELAPIVQKRIGGISEELLRIEKDTGDQPKIDELLNKAELAFEEQHFTVPEEENVINYTAQILEADPAHSRALELQALVINYYQEKAAAAEKRRRYRTAINYYENVLLILPDDAKTLEKIANLKKR